MRDPNAVFFRTAQRVAATGRMVGADRPVGRVTISRNTLSQHYSTRPGPWRSLQHVLDSGGERELETVLSINIERSLGDDAATATIVLVNDDLLSDQPQGVDTAGRTGYLTPNRGDTTPIKRPSVYAGLMGAPPEGPNDVIRTEWGYPRNYNYAWLLPNRLLRTYQGYGSANFDADGIPRKLLDPARVEAHRDTRLALTGTWLIDTVSYGTDGRITVACRDLGKLLLEQICYPPMLPLERFPLTYCPVVAPVAARGGTGIGRNVIRAHSAAHELHQPKVFRGGIFGHNTADAFDGRPGTYYLGHGYPAGESTYFMEWIQGACDGNKVNEVVLDVVKTGYTLYISVMEHGVWQGGGPIPYTHGRSHDHGTRIPYVTKLGVGREQLRVVLPRTYDAQFIRFTFANMQPFNLGFDGQAHSERYPNRVAVREIQAGYAEPYHPPVPGTAGRPGTVTDWSEAVKELLGWAGFTAPVNRDARGRLTARSAPIDPLLGTATGGTTPSFHAGVGLRVWGDFEHLGAGPVECTPGDFFLNKSFMECAKTVADFLGAVFFIDESGGAVFRMPNLFSGGNFVTDPEARVGTPAYLKRTWPIELHENINLLDYKVNLDDSALRSEVVVVGTNPDTNSAAPLAAGVVLGRSTTTSNASGAVDFGTLLGGQSRLFLVPGESTKGFTTVAECQRMAELIGVKILFSYRRGQAQILGHPGIQIDDQVRIFERVTNEFNVHSVSSISSAMDLTSGSWTMDLTTHWLGDDPDRDWFLKTSALTPAVRNLPAVLARLGTSAGGR